MPPGQDWTKPQPHLLSAAIALSAGRPGFSIAALDAADSILERLPADQEAACRLAAALIRLTASRRAGDMATAAAAARAEVLLNRIPAARLARHRKIRARLLSGRGAAELWSGQLDQAARTLESGIAAAAAPGGEGESDDCLAHLALVEALRGRPGRAATLGAQATAACTTGEPRPTDPHPSPAALVALAWMHLELGELREARSRPKHADAALGVTPDKLIEAVARLAAAYGSLAQARAAVTAESAARARSGWSLPAWLDERLSLVESWAYATAGDSQAALAAARRSGQEDSPEAAVTLAHARVADGDAGNATRALAPVLAAGRGVPEQVLLRDPELARAHRCVLGPPRCHDQLPARQGSPGQGSILAVEPLSEREREVLRHVSGLLSTAEVASKMHISVNTVKTHLDHIYRKLATTRRGEAVRRARQLDLI